MPVGELAAIAPAPERSFTHRVSALGCALFPARLLLFLALFAWHLQVAVDLRCVFFAQNDLFLWNYRFLHDFLVVPGGVAEWLGKLVLQFCYDGWPGTVVLTAIAWLACIATIGFLRGLSSAGAGIAWTCPAVAMLAAHGVYDYPFSTSIGATLAVLAALAYVQCVSRWARWRFVIFLGLCLLLFYLAGAAMYVFALCVGIYEAYARGSRLAVLGFIVVVVAVKYSIDGILATVHPGLLYLRIPSTHPWREVMSLSAASVAVYASFPIAALALADWAAKKIRTGRTAASSLNAGNSHAPPAGGITSVRSVAGTVLFLAIAVLVAQATLRRDVRTVLQLHDSADRERWDDVLRLATRVSTEMYSQFVTHDVNQALYHTGRLPHDMFAYPQLSEPFVLLTQSDPYHLCRRRISDFHLLLGRVNDAEVQAAENYVTDRSAHCIRQLARIAIVKGRVELARMYLKVLRDDLTYGAWADDCLQRLQVDPTFSGDPEIMQIRSRMITADNLHYRTAPPTAALLTPSAPGQLSSLVRQNPPNRMAFEYTMARYLVIRNLEVVVQLLPLAASLAYPTIPPLYEEAAVIYARVHSDRTEPSDDGTVVNGCRISEQTLNKVRRLDARLGPGTPEAAEIVRVADEVGLAYFHYYYGR